MRTDMILVDLQKGFDTLDHGVLLEKLKYFGFRTSVKWFEPYFLVCIDNVFSETGTLMYGVPQASILGPFLFVLYVNDLPLSLSDTGSNDVAIKFWKVVCCIIKPTVTLEPLVK